jgi:bifunctional DNA-binding transcriptional regulator/antitoxin component of YhaV-PrlF toxin-antitoxin module
MLMRPTYIPLRRINDTLRINMPIAFKRRYDLKDGDQVVWIEDENGVRLRFVRMAEAPAISMTVQQKATDTAA